MKSSFCFITFILSIPVVAQTEIPAVFLSQIEMTASGGQPYDEFYWLNSNNASLTKSAALFSKTGSYRVDVSAYKTAGTPVLSVLIDGISKGNITVSSTEIAIYSFFISSVTAGTHSIKLQLSNFNSAANHVRVGLVYFTQTSQKTPYIYPKIVPIPLVPNQILQRNHFGSGHLRGFSLGSNGANQAGENDQNMRDMIKTGANIARCFVEIYRPSGNTYVFKSGELTKLDTTVARAARLGYYVVPVLFHDPSYNTDYWGTGSDAIARRNSITILWRTLATKYKNSAAVAAYDLINEPRSNFNYAECIRWEAQMIRTIRAIDRKHVCMVECISNDMFAMMLPLPDTNIVYSAHGYSPINITHQGVPGEPEADVRNKYPTVRTTKNQGMFGKSDLSKQHDGVRIITHRFNVPVFIGEFSCVNWSPMNDSNGWTSTKWTDDNISLIEAEGWSWVYHGWRGDWPAWEAEIPSSYYNQFTFVDAAPQNLPDYSTWIKARSSTAPTITMLKKWFAFNADNSYVMRFGDLTIKNQNGNSFLKWRSNKINVSHFNVQRSPDGLNFKTIGKVEALNKNTITSNYTYTDTVSLTGKFYYRLQMIDKDSEYVFSEILPISFVGKNLVTISPNPVKDVLNIHVPGNGSDKISIQVVDMSGKVLINKQLLGSGGNDIITIPVPSLSKGIYNLRIVQNNEVQSIKFMKE